MNKQTVVVVAGVTALAFALMAGMTSRDRRIRRMQVRNKKRILSYCGRSGAC